MFYCKLQIFIYMKQFIKKLIREYFEDDYDFSVFDEPKKVKSNKPDNFKNIVLHNNEPSFI